MSTIVFDGITLNPSMVWSDRFISQKVRQETRFTLGGRPVVFAGVLVAGTPITLEATADQGWLQKSVVDALLERADIPGAVYTLAFNGENYQVVFRHDEQPAVDMQPIVARVAHADTDYFTGTIKLLTV